MGGLINMAGLDPARALYWAAVVNGVLAAPLMAVMMLIARNRRANGGSAAAGYENGVLTVTGVSDVGAADKNGQSYVTVSGTIIGGSTAPTEVYGTLVLDVGLDKPYVGEEKAVSGGTWRTMGLPQGSPAVRSPSAP